MKEIKNKKVGIITFHRAVNAGSFLQSYALSTIVKNFGYQPELIDYYSDHQRQQYAKLYLNNTRSKSLSMKVFLIIYRLLLVPSIRKIKRYNHNYHAFVEAHLPISNLQYHNAEDLEESKFNYMAYISGSDQIWNTKAVDFSSAYLLDFVKSSRKISYAPSFGGSSSFSDEYMTELSEYDYISVREKIGAQYASELLGREIPYVLDPTFLLKADDYAALERSSGIEGDYIFYYSIGYNIKQRILVNKLARKNKIKVVSWNPQQYALDKLLIRNLIQPKVQNPGVWLDLMRHAKVVLSGSFHGSVFSVIYKKNFGILSSKPNDRLEIFNELGLNYRSSSSDGLPKIFKYADVDKKKLQELKNRSMTFLQHALNERNR